MNKRTFLAAAALVVCGVATAQTAAPVEAHVPWARATVQGQRTGGAYVTLVAGEPVTLVGATSPVAGRVELHEMKMDGDVMRMRQVDGLALPARQPVQLKPGGHHLMLLDLKAPLAPNTSIPVTLLFKTARGDQRQLALQVPVSATPPKEATAGASAGGHRH